jgi:hypothetical protein
MGVGEALKALGSNKVVWIDDKFNTTPGDLADLLISNRETAASCGFFDLDPILAIANVNESDARVALTEKLSELTIDRVAEIRTTFFEKESGELGFATRELTDKAIAKVCDVLQVVPDNRWTFDKAADEIAKVKDGNDQGTAYVIDLNEAGGSDTRGLEILRQLAANGSKGDAFILTHAASVSTEAEKEAELRRELARNGGSRIQLPVCVIAKERLFEYEKLETLHSGLAVGIKRAGLRRSLFDVIDSVGKTISDSFENAAEALLSVPPEQLDSFVFERGYKEGVSELHIVERILTAQIGRDIRMFFGSDQNVLNSVFRIRALRDILLTDGGKAPDENLARFRMAEIWESEDLINHSFSPIACGDVFELDQEEKDTAGLNKRFVLLGQPCDVALRPDGKRAHEFAFLVLMKEYEKGKEDQSPKVYPLPFKLNGKQWACDFRATTVVRLDVLDLASFRTDGRVRVDAGHSAPAGLLMSQQKIYPRRTAPANKVLEAATAIKGGGLLKDGLQLSVSQDSPFNKVFSATFADVSAPKAEDDPSDNLKRVTWRLRRVGRLRQPYIAALLDQQLDLMGRHAFDVDFMDVMAPEEAEHTQREAAKSVGGELAQKTGVEPADGDEAVDGTNAAPKTQS